MKGKIIFTDKDHYRAEKKSFSSIRVAAAEKLVFSDDGTDGFLGFGVAITPSSCYELNLMSSEEREALLKNVYCDIGLSVGRLCIGSCDYSPELYSYDDHPFDTSLEHFSVERDEEYVIPMIKEILKIKPDLYLFASPWSPPYWMKTGGSMCGGYMRNEYLDCYADYIIKFIEAYAGYGIKISALTPQNEVNTQQNGRMPACVWHPETEAEFIKILRRKLDEKGLDVGIWMYDHNFNDTERVIWSLDNIKGLKEICGGVAFHYYGGAIEQTGTLRRKHPDIKCHFSEGGPRLSDNYGTDFCKWGLMMIKALKMGFYSFTGWNLMLDEMGGPHIGPFMGICGGLVTRDSRDGALSYSGQYKAFSHIAPYISPNSKIYPVSVSESFNMNMSEYPKHDINIEGVMIDNGGENKTVVLVNPNARGIQSQFEANGELFYLEIPAESINTVIFE